MTRNPSKGLKALGRVKLKKSEAGAHRVFARFGQSLPIKIARVDLPSKSRFPYVPFEHWLRYLVQQDQLDQLCGTRDLPDIREALKEFWSKYQEIHSTHEIFARAAAGSICLDLTIPVVCHGDEGRGLKRKQLMVFSCAGILGKGSSHEDEDVKTSPLRLNMKGRTFLTQFLSCVMPIGLYNKSPESLMKVLDVQAREFRMLFEEGVVIDDKRFFICCLGMKGDAPYLSKSGCFERNFARRPTRPTSRKGCVGICHVCMAGDETREPYAPYEDYGSQHPAWKDTMFAERPYSVPSPYFQIPFEQGGATPEAMFRFDLFHNWHMGLGKNFISSAVCICLELVDATIENAFKIITADFQAYCTNKRESPYHKRLSGSLFGVEGSFNEWPDGGWSKGDFTRLLCKWFQNYCERQVIGCTEDPLYLKCVT